MLLLVSGNVNQFLFYWNVLCLSFYIVIFAWLSSYLCGYFSAGPHSFTHAFNDTFLGLCHRLPTHSSLSPWGTLLNLWLQLPKHWQCLHPYPNNNDSRYYFCYSYTMYFQVLKHLILTTLWRKYYFYSNFKDVKS